MGKEERNTYTIQEEEIGQVQIADEVVAIIAGLAAMEVDGVSSMAGTSTRDLISKLGKKNLSKGVKAVSYTHLMEKIPGSKIPIISPP